MFKNKFSLSLIVLAVFSLFVFSVSTNNATAASTSKKTPTTAKVKVQGLAKLVLAGTVISQNNGSLTIHITSSSKNAKVFKNKDVTVSTDSKTRITKSGKAVSVATLSTGTKVKVFGIFDKKAGTIKQIRWIKVSK